jgi:hypothetical protein
MRGAPKQALLPADLFDFRPDRITAEHVIAIGERFALRPPTQAQMEEGRAIAASLIDPDIAPAAAYAEAAIWSGMCALVFTENEKVTGMVAILFLSREGLEAVAGQGFNARAPHKLHLVRAGEPVFGGYAWGIAATSQQGGRICVAFADAVRREAFSRVPVFSRAATADGLRVLTGYLGYRPVPWGEPGVVWIDPRAEAGQA